MQNIILFRLIRYKIIMNVTMLLLKNFFFFVFFSSRRRHTRFLNVTGVQTCALPISADLVETQRGVRGGYRLTKAPAAISLVDIVEAMEGPIAVTDCVDGAQDPCAVSNCCFMSSHWNHVNLAIRNALNDVSLEDLTDPAQLFPLPVSPPITEDDSQLSRQ